MAGSNQQSSLLGKIAAYTEILDKDPQSTIFVSLSEAYRKMGMLDDARTVAESGLEHHTDFTPAHIVLARIFCQQGDHQASANHFERALELDSASLSALVGYARLKILTGDEDAARPLLLEARKQSPADPVINKLLLSLPEPQPVEVIPQVEIVVEPEPEEVESEESSSQSTLVSATLAELYLGQGLEAQALEMFRQLSEQSPNNLELRRKIRDLEDKLTGSEVEATETDAISQPVENPDLIPEPAISIQGSPAGDKRESEAVATSTDVHSALTTDGDDSTAPIDSAEPVPSINLAKIDRLNQWLESVQQRRRDV